MFPVKTETERITSKVRNSIISTVICFWQSTTDMTDVKIGGYSRSLTDGVKLNCDLKSCLCVSAVCRPLSPQQYQSLWIIHSVLSQQLCLRSQAALCPQFISVWTGFSQQTRRTRRLLSVSSPMLLTPKLDPLFTRQRQQVNVLKSTEIWEQQKVKLLPGAQLQLCLQSREGLQPCYSQNWTLKLQLLIKLQIIQSEMTSCNRLTTDCNRQ